MPKNHKILNLRTFLMTFNIRVLEENTMHLQNQSQILLLSMLRNSNKMAINEICSTQMFRSMDKFKRVFYELFAKAEKTSNMISSNQ